MFAYMMQGLSLGLSAAAQPGPFQAYLIGQSLKIGWRRALPAVLAPLISDGPIIAVMLLVLTRFPASFLRAVQIAGGLYVLYLAWKSYKAWRDYQPVTITGETTERQSVLQAAMMNFLSPGPYIFWSLLAGPVLIKGWHETPARGLGFIFGFYFALIGGMVTLTVLFGVARQLGPKVNRALIGISAIALFGFGIYQLITGILGI